MNALKTYNYDEQGTSSFNRKVIVKKRWRVNAGTNKLSIEALMKVVSTVELTAIV